MSLSQMSVYGAILIAVIVVVRSLTIHKLPKRVFVLLWGIAVLRLLVPFSVPAPVSVYTLVPEYMPVEDAAGREGGLADVPAGKAQPPVKEGAEAPVPRDALAVPGRVLVWLAGAVCCAAFFLVCYVRCRREFCMSLPVEDAAAGRWLSEHKGLRSVQIRQLDQIAAPLTYGIFRPVILVPKGMDWEDGTMVECVLMHEYVHIRRLDALWKLFAAAAFCIHWFNPMVWAMYVLFNKDVELACDECVVRRLSGDARSAYALTLIAMEEKKSGLLPLYNSFSRNAIEERIMEIMRVKKVTAGIAAVSIALVAVIAAVFATTSGKRVEASDAASGNPADTAEAVAKPQQGGGAEDGHHAENGAAAGDADHTENGAAVGSADHTENEAGTGSSARTEVESGVNQSDAGGQAAGPEKRLVYIYDFDGKTLVCDEVEWVVVPGARADELGLTDADSPNGFYVYNETVLNEEIPFADDCKCTLLDWTGGYGPMEVAFEDLKEILAERTKLAEEVGAYIPYHLTIENGEIIEIHEQYVP